MKGMAYARVCSFGYLMKHVLSAPGKCMLQHGNEAYSIYLMMIWLRTCITGRDDE